MAAPVRKYPSKAMLSICHKLVSVTDGSYLAFPSWCSPGKVQKFDTVTKKWSAVMDLRRMNLKGKIFDVHYERDSNILHLVVNPHAEGAQDSRLWSIDIEKGTAFQEHCTVQFWIGRLYYLKWMVIGKEHHFIGLDYPQGSFGQITTRGFIHYRRGHSRGRLERKTINSRLCNLKQVLHSESRDSLIAYGCSGNKETIICEFSLETKEWTEWEWVRFTPYWDGTGVVVSADGNYLVAFGCRNILKSKKRSPSSVNGNITVVYDINKEKALESNIWSPVGGRRCTITMSNKRMDEFLVHGFVNQSYKESAFDGLQLMPRYLIDLVGKWVLKEYIYLIQLDTGDNSIEGHYQMNFDNILNAVE